MFGGRVYSWGVLEAVPHGMHVQTETAGICVGLFDWHRGSNNF